MAATWPLPCLSLCCRRKPNRVWFPLPQVSIYAEDFKSERADRERAQGVIADLKEQVCHLKRQLLKQVSPQTVAEAPPHPNARPRPP